jgi:hypothetical protein
MSDLILEQTNSANQISKKMLWKGKKYISFTDSRQGTAKISALINIDSETYWLRSQVFHSLCKERIELQNQRPQLTEEEKIASIEEIAKLKEELSTITLPILLIKKG